MAGGNEVATAVVGITANAKDLQSQIKSVAESSKSQMKGLSSQLGNIAKGIAAAFAGALSIAKIRESVDLARTQVEAEKKLEAVLRATSHAAGFSAKELKKFASEWQDLTTHGDEGTIEFMNILLTFRNVAGETFKRAIKLGSDMSVVFGQGLRQTAIMLGKALQDPILGMTALTRTGITFTNEQKAMVRVMQEAGDIAGAQAVILDELAAQVEGTSEAMKKTDFGMLDSLSNTLGDVKEEIGKKFVPALILMTEAKVEFAKIVNAALVPLGQFLRSMLGINEETRRSAIQFGVAAIAMTTLVTGIGFAITAMRALSGTMIAWAATVPIIKVATTAIGGLVTVLKMATFWSLKLFLISPIKSFVKVMWLAVLPVRLLATQLKVASLWAGIVFSSKKIYAFAKAVGLVKAAVLAYNFALAAGAALTGLVFPIALIAAGTTAIFIFSEGMKGAKDMAKKMVDQFRAAGDVIKIAFSGAAKNSSITTLVKIYQGARQSIIDNTGKILRIFYLMGQVTAKIFVGIIKAFAWVGKQFTNLVLKMFGGKATRSAYKWSKDSVGAIIEFALDAMEWFDVIVSNWDQTVKLMWNATKLGFAKIVKFFHLEPLVNAIAGLGKIQAEYMSDLTKAFGGPFTALGFTKSIKQALEGDLVGGFKTAMKVISLILKSWAGFAFHIFSGTVDTIGNIFGVDNLGMKIQAAFIAFKPFWDSFVGSIASGSAVIMKWFGDAGLFVQDNFIRPFMNAFATISSAFTSGLPSGGESGGFLGLINGIYQAVVAILPLLGPVGMLMQQQFMAVKNVITGLATGNFEPLLEQFMKLFTVAKFVWEGIGIPAIKWGAAIAKVWLTLFAQIYQTIVAFMTPVWTLIAEIASAWIKNLSAIFSGIKKFLKGDLDLVGLFKVILKAIANQFVTTFWGIIKAVGKILIAIPERLIAGIAAMIPVIIDMIKTAIGSLWKMIKAAGAMIKNMPAILWGQLTGEDPIGKMFRDGMESAKRHIKEIKNTFSGALSDMGKEAGDENPFDKMIGDSHDAAFGTGSASELGAGLSQGAMAATALASRAMGGFGSGALLGLTSQVSGAGSNFGLQSTGGVSIGPSSGGSFGALVSAKNAAEGNRAVLAGSRGGSPSIGSAAVGMAIGLSGMAGASRIGGKAGDFLSSSGIGGRIAGGLAAMSSGMSMPRIGGGGGGGDGAIRAGGKISMSGTVTGGGMFAGMSTPSFGSVLSGKAGGGSPAAGGLAGGMGGIASGGASMLRGGSTSFSGNAGVPGLGALRDSTARVSRIMKSYGFTGGGRGGGGVGFSMPSTGIDVAAGIRRAASGVSSAFSPAAGVLGKVGGTLNSMFGGSSIGSMAGLGGSGGGGFLSSIGGALNSALGGDATLTSKIGAAGGFLGAALGAAFAGDDVPDAGGAGGPGLLNFKTGFMGKDINRDIQEAMFAANEKAREEEKKEKEKDKIAKHAEDTALNTTALAKAMHSRGVVDHINVMVDERMGYAMGPD